MTPGRWRRVLAVVGAGAFSGLVAGSLMLLTAMIHAEVTDLGFWLPLRQVAALWFGVDALIGDGGVILVGLLTHLVVAAGWGIVFAALTRSGPSLGVSLVLALAFATALWMVMTWVVVPVVAPVMYERIRLVPVAWYAIHLVFGAGLALAPVLAWFFEGRPRDRTEEAEPAGEPALP